MLLAKMISVVLLISVGIVMDAIASNAEVADGGMMMLMMVAMAEKEDTAKN